MVFVPTSARLHHDDMPFATFRGTKRRPHGESTPQGPLDPSGGAVNQAWRAGVEVHSTSALPADGLKSGFRAGSKRRAWDQGKTP